MRPGGLGIHGHGSHLSHVVAHHQKIKTHLLRFNLMDCEVSEVNLLVKVLVDRHFVPLVERSLQVLFVQQIVALFVVDLKIRDVDLLW